MGLKRSPHEVEEMRERKKQKNRESAQRARDRFKTKMRWLEDQVRNVTERHDNLLRENTYMRHMLGEQSQKLNLLLQKENEAIAKENSSRSSDSEDSGSYSPRRGKSSFSIGFLSKSASDEKKELSSMISDRITASGIASQFKQSQASSRFSISNLSNPLGGIIPNQTHRNSPFMPPLPSVRLSPGGTMHMDNEDSPDLDECEIEDIDEEIDVGSPVRSDSDHGIGTEHTHSEDGDNM